MGGGGGDHTMGGGGGGNTGHGTIYTRDSLDTMTTIASIHLFILFYFNLG